MIYKIEDAPKDNKAILGWFPQSRCWFTMDWYADKWQSFGGLGDFDGEEPTYWTDLPPLLEEEYNSAGED